MSEVMICRGCSGGGDDGKYKVFKRIIFEESVNWVVPDDIVDNEVRVRIVGSSGETSIWWDSNWINGCAGGSGWLNNGIFNLVPGEKISIELGGLKSSSSFGKYLIANSGSGPDGAVGFYGKGKNGQITGKSYQFGGTVGGGDGGVWGGGGGATSQSNYCGGNGGMYGGGGGGEEYNGVGKFGLGGRYGGNGGNRNIQAENGTNTIGWTNVDRDIITGEYITGPGLRGSWRRDLNNGSFCCGGGGFGGCAKSGYSSSYYMFSGGGGYGANVADVNPDQGSYTIWGGAGYGKGAGGGCEGPGGGYYTKGPSAEDYYYKTANLPARTWGDRHAGFCVIEYLSWIDFIYKSYDNSYHPEYDNSNKYPILY